MRKKRLLCDFHTHSTFSDGKLTIPEVIDLYGKLGFGAIAITDHIAEEKTLIGRAATAMGKVLTQATFPLYMAILESESQRAWEQYQLVVLPGFELSKNTILNHRSAHLLGIGISSYIPADAEAEQLVDAIHEQQGIAIAAHPVFTRKVEKQTYYLWDRRDTLSQKIDAWEVASGPHIFHEVRDSKLPKIASSDLHVRSQMRSWKTVLHCEPKPQPILEAIRKQQIDFHYFINHGK